jgi:hypothetical protein
MTIDYATKHVEAKVLRTNIIVLTVKFLYECIITRFGCPLTIDLDQGVHFINDVIKHLTYQFLLIQFHYLLSVGEWSSKVH